MAVVLTALAEQHNLKVVNLAEVKPTLLVSVPRIFNKIYDGVNKQMADKPAVVRALFGETLATPGERRGQ